MLAGGTTGATFGGIGTYVGHVQEALVRKGHDAAIMPLGVKSAVLAAWSPELIHVHGYLSSKRFLELTTIAPMVRTLHNASFSCSTGDRYLADGVPCNRIHGTMCLAHWPQCAHTGRLDRTMRSYARVTKEQAMLPLFSERIVHSRWMRTLAASHGLATRQIPMPSPGYSIDLPRVTAAPGPNRVLYVGRLTKAKGVHHLLRAAAGSSWAVDIVGDGWHLSALKAQARRLGVPAVFWGSLPSTEVRQKMAKAVLLCLPSLGPESFGLVGLEAMRQRCPVVAYNGGAIGEWLQDRVNGLLVPHGDWGALRGSIDSVVNSRPFRESLGRGALATAQDWPSLESHVSDLLGVYRECQDDWCYRRFGHGRSDSFRAQKGTTR